MNWYHTTGFLGNRRFVRWYVAVTFFNTLSVLALTFAASAGILLAWRLLG